MRYGNKSVISKICEDDEMPFTEDGRRVDLMLNLLAIINRTTSAPIFELMITSICYQVRKKMETMVDYKEKEALLFDIVNEFNENQKEAMWSLYLKLSEDEKKDYIDDAIYNGIYIHQSPLWETKPIFYRLNDILEKYPWLSADNVYINKWGRKIKTLRKAWIGQMYIMKLKQSPIRGHSVRSTGAIDTKGIPTRSYRSRSHLEQYSGTPIRFGEFETLNFSIAVVPEDIALFHALYRTSIKGRKDLVKLLFNDNKNAVQKIDSSYTSRVAEIFNVILKSMSIGLEFADESNYIYALDTNTVSMHTLNGKNYFCTDYEFFMIERKEEIRQEILRDNPVITSTDLEAKIEEVMKSKDYVMGRTD